MDLTSRLGKTIKNNDCELHCAFFFLSSLNTHRVRKRRTLCLSKLRSEYTFLFKCCTGRKNILLGLKRKKKVNSCKYEGMCDERFHCACLQLTASAPDELKAAIIVLSPE